MNQDLNHLEEKLKKTKKRKEHKVSGRSVLKLQEIIKAKSADRREKSEKESLKEDSNENSTS